LRIESDALVGAHLTIYGVAMGTLPWEGTLAPGTHVYEIERNDLGTGPTSALVVQGQTILVRPEVKPLGPAVRVAVEPATAYIFIDGVKVADGGWSGRLPVGFHTIAAREEGY